jgi:hypothetical protein
MIKGFTAANFEMAYINSKMKTITMPTIAQHGVAVAFS